MGNGITIFKNRNNTVASTSYRVIHDVWTILKFAILVVCSN